MTPLVGPLLAKQDVKMVPIYKICIDSYISIRPLYTPRSHLGPFWRNAHLLQTDGRTDTVIGILYRLGVVHFCHMTASQTDAVLVTIVETLFIRFAFLNCGQREWRAIQVTEYTAFRTYEYDLN